MAVAMSLSLECYVMMHMMVGMQSSISAPSLQWL